MWRTGWRQGEGRNWRGSTSLDRWPLHGLPSTQWRMVWTQRAVVFGRHGSLDSSPLGMSMLVVPDVESWRAAAALITARPSGTRWLVRPGTAPKRQHRTKGKPKSSHEGRQTRPEQSTSCPVHHQQPAAGIERGVVCKRGGCLAA
jgi:hypothetical protein